jgi:hypothetical protein
MRVTKLALPSHADAAIVYAFVFDHIARQSIDAPRNERARHTHALWDTAMRVACNVHVIVPIVARANVGTRWRRRSP